MKCNQCGSENADTAVFCSTCGSSLQTGATVTATPLGQSGPTIVSSIGPNGPTTSLAVPIKSKKVVAVLITLIALVICGGVVAAILLNINTTATYSCTKAGDALTSSVAATFKRNKLSKMEYTMIVEGADLGGSSSSNVTVYSPDSWDFNWEWDPNDPEGSFFNSSSDDSWSYSSSNSTNSLSTMNQQETMELLALSLMFANFQQYADDPGVEYYENERDTIATYSVTLDIDKLAKKTKADIFDDPKELETTPDEFQKAFKEQGYVCSAK